MLLSLKNYSEPIELVRAFEETAKDVVRWYFSLSSLPTSRGSLGAPPIQHPTSTKTIADVLEL
jgi:hypothetical protein